MKNINLCIDPWARRNDVLGLQASVRHSPKLMSSHLSFGANGACVKCAINHLNLPLIKFHHVNFFLTFYFLYKLVPLGAFILFDSAIICKGCIWGVYGVVAYKGYRPGHI